MKYAPLLSGLVLLFSSHAIAHDDKNLTEEQIQEVEALLTEAAGKLIYMNNECDAPVDAEKFKELAKIKAFSEGYQTIEGISWEHVKEDANRQYEALKMQAPEGELCEKFKNDFKNAYPFLKDTNAT